MTLDDFNPDMAAVREKRRTLIEETATLDLPTLRALTEELYDRLGTFIQDVDDAATVFIPDDPAEDGAPGWNLAHVIAHLTAGLEENAVQASTLARGAEITGRPRYETPWEEITTAERLQQRLAESRRMTVAFLETWPDHPHLNATHEHPRFEQMNALTYMALGLSHAKGHLPQIQEILRQVEARTVVQV